MQGWRGIYSVVTGHEPDQEFVEPYMASILFFAINMITGIILRAFSATVLPPSTRGLAMDFVSTMEACAYFFENNFVLKHYGSLWFGVVIACQSFICARTFGESSENPVKALHQFLHKEITAQTALVKIAVMSLAGLASYRLAKLIWSLDLIEDHHERYYETSCESDLHVTLLLGFLLELGACLSETWLGLQTVSTKPIVDEWIKYINAATMITLGVSTTGMYFNPAMASGHTLGCEGTALPEHFFVYWAGPFIGCFVGILLNKMLHIDVTGSKGEHDKKTN
ncbi:Aquaporin-12B [Bulinus truncatus]|nr:Aquaporin-12B [Bulinus truncatus]